MSKVEASVDPDAILRYGHVFLRVNRPVTPTRDIWPSICIHLRSSSRFGQGQWRVESRNQWGIGGRENRTAVIQAAPRSKRVLYLTIFAPTAGEIKTEPEGQELGSKFLLTCNFADMFAVSSCYFFHSYPSQTLSSLIVPRLQVFTVASAAERAFVSYCLECTSLPLERHG